MSHQELTPLTINVALESYKRESVFIPLFVSVATLGVSGLPPFPDACGQDNLAPTKIYSHEAMHFGTKEAGHSRNPNNFFPGSKGM